jgi:hypothetical protein
VLYSKIDKQVLDIARHIASKQQVLDTILQSESKYIQDLNTFHELYTIRLQNWFNESTDKELNAKFKTTPARKDLDKLFHTLHDLSMVHSAFLKDLKDRLVNKCIKLIFCTCKLILKKINRLLLWGPTQLISDILNKLVSIFFSFFFRGHYYTKLWTALSIIIIIVVIKLRLHTYRPFFSMSV